MGVEKSLRTQNSGWASWQMLSLSTKEIGVLVYVSVPEGVCRGIKIGGFKYPCHSSSSGELKEHVCTSQLTSGAKVEETKMPLE